MSLPRLYRGLTAAAAPLVSLGLRWRERRGKEDGARLGERFGVAAAPRPAGPLMWIHAASVGEANSVLALIERVVRERPGLAVLITTGTVTSARLVAPRLPPRALHHYVPVDLPGAVARFLDHWRPDFAVWVESELWPNLVLDTARRGIPMALVNARLSARSRRRWRATPGLARAMLASFAVCLTQDDEQARRFRELGAAAAESVGDLKSAAEELPADPAALAALRRQIGARPCWLAASTHPGEEDAAAAAHRRLARDYPAVLTVVVPRHPVRGESIAARLRAAGFAVARRAAGEAVEPGTAIYLADTLGELGLFYRAAGIAFIGGSLSGHGGHNPFEAARLGCAILHGPHVENFRAIAEALAKAGASETVADEAALARAVAALLGDEALRARRGAAARRVSEEGRGVLERVLAALAPELAALDAREAQLARA